MSLASTDDAERGNYLVGRAIRTGSGSDRVQLTLDSTNVCGSIQRLALKRARLAEVYIAS